jgi:hypothetical protein
MTYELDNQDKINMVNQHIKNLSYAKYDAELSKIEALAVNTVEQVASMSFQDQIDDLTAKILKLEEVLDTLHPTE